jgi:hypothetical protein
MAGHLLGTRAVDSLLMNLLMEWHDSELVAIDAASATEGEILLDAYVYRKLEEAVNTAVEGGKRRVRINVPSMRSEHPVPEMPSLNYDGVLVLGGVGHNGLVPLPMRFEGEVRLTLTMRGGIPELRFSGTGMTIEVDGEFRFVEMVPFDPFDQFRRR